MNTILDQKKQSLTQPFPYNSFDDLPLYDQRVLPRWKTTKRAYFRLNDSNVIQRTQIRDLSLAGVCVHLPSNIHINQKVEMKIYLTADVSFAVEGTILWKRIASDDSCYAGIIFETLVPKTQELILQYAFEGVVQEV